MPTRADENEDPRARALAVTSDATEAATEAANRSGGPARATPSFTSIPRARPIDELDLARASASVLSALFGEDAPPREPTVLAGRYELLEALGSGGFGMVYRARDRDRGTIVALKVLHNASASQIARFKREFRALADLVHPNLVTLYELHHDGAHDRWFFTMRLIDGADFHRHVRGASPAKRPATRAVERQTTILRPRAGSPEPPTELVFETDPITPLDYDELRRCLAQLARGVAALHAAGMIHRDLKPSNVLVEATGTVVILDFGLIVETSAEVSSLRSSPLAGTPAYMAPEQALGEAASFAGDWYSVGVMLYEALTGARPFDGHPARRLLETVPFAPDPRRRVPETPDDLAELCAALLQLDPTRRAGADTILRRLEERGARRLAAADHARGDAAAGERPRGASFVGRARELRRLQVALAGVADGRCGLALVRGASGIGKSTLLRRFRKHVRTVIRDALVLSGRCYEQESVPFKALDGVMDALALALARAPRERAAALMNEDIAALARLFPTLTEVEAARVRCERVTLAGAPRSPELRRRAARALRELLTRISARRLVVISIDDLHWGDGDSAALLGELLRDAPPPVLFTLSFRSEELLANDALRRLVEELQRAETPGYALHEIALAPLSPADASALVRRLREVYAGDAAPRDPGLVEALARESGGHPLFIHELVRSALARRETPRDEQRARATATATPRLDDILWTRLQQLPADARRLLEIVCVSGRPISEGRACRAAGVERGREEAVARLRAGQLLRVFTDEDERERIIEAYHDRVRETVAARLDDAVRRRHHAQLAREYEDGAADHEVVALHLRAAGEPVLAATHALIAGRRALESMAFQRAARLLQQALDEGEQAPAERRDLMALLGGALVDAGRSAEAADMYLRAASEHPPASAIALRQLASAQLFRAGLLDRGYAVLREVLRDLGERFPSTTAAALTRIAWGRARVAGPLARALRRPPPVGGRAHARKPSPEARARLETYWSLGTTLGMLDTLRGAVYQNQHLALALRSGDPHHTALAISSEAVFTALVGYRARHRARRLLARAQLLAEAEDHPKVHGFVAFSRGMIALLIGRYDLARDEGARAEEYLKERCVGVSWEIATVRSTRGTGLLFTGRWRELADWLPSLFREADERGDRYARAILETQLRFATELARDEVELAREQAARALERWPQGRFQLTNFFNLTSRVEIELYAGRGRRAHELIESGWRDFDRSLLRRTEINRLQALLLRARSNLVLARGLPRRRRAGPLHAALRLAHTAAARTTPWAVAYADAIRGGVAAARGRLGVANELLLRAEEGLGAAALELHAAAARRQRARLMSGAVARELTESADATIRDLGITAPERLARSLAPLPIE